MKHITKDTVWALTKNMSKVTRSNLKRVGYTTEDMKDLFEALYDCPGCNIKNMADETFPYSDIEDTHTYEEYDQCDELGIYRG